MTPGTALRQMRETTPLVHCITNYVAMTIAANVTLAAGASPAMVHAPEEVGDFTPLSKALTINIGTLSAPWVLAMRLSAQAARTHDIPWVLDPVAHFATPYRTAVAQGLLALEPTIIRGNASEIIALSGGAGAGKGADSGDAVADAQDGAADLARRCGCVVVVTGATDFVTDGRRRAMVRGGSDLMPKVTALGCSLTALIGGYAAVAPPFEASVAALVHFAEAGERASGAAGPGSFQVAFLDALHRIQPEDLGEDRLTWL
ncbi:hydroxyethylthiazole kinase [Pseudoroseicyclus aestuarii]|uniref:Hydroxyethylthiazole kinase n=1 Tax=Pseudoroseicyclus aestuarii TaxID=1795041 RepID=A0A318TAL6_9RHOB|nr:hydroxyethylthiazole kinase [Pseudoroseicyclus aestuarii]PYE85348.1 hydroxyethylthiazole kinase [Pseudoroseicyclus aestuarii]